MRKDTIRFQGVDYPFKPVWFSHEEYNGYLLVSTETLRDRLYDETGNFVSAQAERIDEVLFTYVPEEIFKLDQKSIFEYVMQNDP